MRPVPLFGVTLMPSEIVLFDLHDVLITSRRFTVGGRSFALHSIRSLHFLEHGRSWRPAAASASLSALSGLAALTTENSLLAFPAAGLSVLATGLFFHGAPKFGVGLDTEDGYFVPLVSRDRFLVEGVTKTLQSAAQRFGVPLNALADVPGAPRAVAPLLPSAIPLRSSRMPAAMPMSHRIHSV